MAPVYKKGNKTDCSLRHITVVCYIKNFIQISSLNINSTRRKKLLQIFRVHFNVTS